MKRWVWFVLLGVAASAAFVFLASRVRAENVTVTIGVGDTDLIVKGYTSPHAFVTIKSDDSVIGTTTALADGSYSKTFAAQTPGSQKVSVSAYTASGRVTDSVSVHLSVIEHATTTAELFLPTTVAIDDVSLDQDQPLMLHGETTPLSNIKLYLDNSEYAIANSDADGYWSLSIDSSSLVEGAHQFFLRVVDGMGMQSYPTAARSFTYTLRSSSPDQESSPSDGSYVDDVVLTPPLITFPTTGTPWDRSNIVVRGTAQKQVQIELWDGTRLLGSVWSDTDGDWSLNLFLESREYNLRARSCLDGQCSAFSQMTQFTYSSVQEYLYVKISRATFTINTGDMIAINAEIIHGLHPYVIKINWGDGATYSEVINSNMISRSHEYSKPGLYTVTLEVKDKKGQTGRAQYTVHVKENSNSLLSTVTVGFIALVVAMLFPTARRILWSYKIRKSSS